MQVSGGSDGARTTESLIIALIKEDLASACLPFSLEGQPTLFELVGKQTPTALRCHATSLSLLSPAG